MFQKFFNMRNVATIVACLAVSVMFSGCDDKDDPKGGDADITAFTFAGIAGTAVIDPDALTVTATATAAATANLTALVPTFTLSSGATATVNGTAQVSGVTANNFSTTVVYTVTSGDGNLINLWKVTIAATGSNTMLFGIKQGTITYSHSWDYYEGRDPVRWTTTFIFDDYGLRTKVVEYKDDETLTFIHDWIAGCNYRYYADDYPEYEADCFGANPDNNMPTSDHFNEYWWGNRHIYAPHEYDDFKTESNKTIAGADCMVISFTDDGKKHEFAGSNNIVFGAKDYVLDDAYEFEATSFSTSIPKNSFVPYGKDE